MVFLKQVILVIILFSIGINSVKSEENSNTNTACFKSIKDEKIDKVKECLINLPEENTKERAKYEAFIAHKSNKIERAEGYYIDFLKQNEDEENEIYFSILLSQLYIVRNDFYLAMKYLSKANILNEKNSTLNDVELNRAKIKIGILDTFNYLEINDQLIKDYENVIEMLEAINSGESNKIKSDVLYKISILYFKENNYLKAKKYAKEALSIADKENYLFGVAHGYMAEAYVSLLEEKDNKDYAEDLINSAEEIFIILDLQEKNSFNINVLKIKVNLKAKDYIKASKKLQEMEDFFKKRINVNKNLQEIYNLSFQLYQSIDNKVKAIEYKLKEINIRKEIMEAQDTDVIVQFKSEFINNEQVRKANDLEREILVKERESQKEREYSETNSEIIYVVLSFLIIVMLVGLYYVVRSIRVEVLENKAERREEKSDSFTMISFEIEDFETKLKNLEDKYVNQFCLYIENAIKGNLRKGDLLIKIEGKLVIIARATMEEAPFISERIKGHLSRNKMINNNIYFAEIPLDNKGNNDLDLMYKQVRMEIASKILKAKK